LHRSSAPSPADPRARGLLPLAYSTARRRRIAISIAISPRHAAAQGDRSSEGGDDASAGDPGLFSPRRGQTVFPDPVGRWLRSDLVLRLELHRVGGNRFALPDDLVQALARGDLEPTTDLVQVGVQFSF